MSKVSPSRGVDSRTALSRLFPRFALTSPVRTCVGCRERDDKAALVRVVAEDGAYVADPGKRMQGRGAYLHPRSACVDVALRHGALRRALRLGGGVNEERLRDLCAKWD